MTAKEIADYVVADGLNGTNDGSWVTYFDEIQGATVAEVEAMQEEVLREIEANPAVAEACIADYGFDVTYWLGALNQPYQFKEEKGNDMFDKQFVMNNARVGFAQDSNNYKDVLTRKTEFDGIMQYLYVRFDATKSAKITLGIIRALEIDEDALWKAATENTIGQMVVTPMELAIGMVGDSSGIQVVTTRDGFRGAAAILGKDRIGDIIGKGKYYMLPSSVHEVLLMPYSEDRNVNELTMMVRDINAMIVPPEERLSDTAYILEV